MTLSGLVRKNLWRKKLRTILTIVAVAVAFLIFGVLGAFQVLWTTPATGITAQRLAVTNKVNFTEDLPFAYVAKVAALPDVSLVTHATWFGGYFQEERNFLVAFAVDPATYIDVYPEYTISPEAKAAFMKERQAIMVGDEIAQRFGWKPGDRIPLKSNIWRQKDGGDTWEFVVAGTFGSTDPASPAGYVFFRYDYLNETRSFGADAIGNMTVVPKPGADKDRLSKEIDALFMNSDAETATQTEAAFNQSFFAQLGDIGFIITAVVGAAFLTILLIAGNTMMLTVRERMGEIAVLKTIGFTGPKIFGMVLGESFLVALIGGLVGLGLAWLAVGGLAASGIGFFSGMTMPGSVAAVGVALAAALALITGAAPAWRAMNADIAGALSRK